jgi:hypothetical protein
MDRKDNLLDRLADDLNKAAAMVVKESLILTT